MNDNYNQENNRSSRLNDDNETHSQVSNDEDPILTATITFDVTVDPNGQVISTSEGQIVAESIQKPNDGRTLSQVEKQAALSEQSSDAYDDESLQSPTNESKEHESGSGNQTSNNTDAITQNSYNENDNTHADSLAQQDDSDDDDDDESTSTTTESLIERSKKYMDQEAGIIILKRDDDLAAPKNFNINLDFDLNDAQNQTSRKSSRSNQNEDEDGVGQPEGFNINLDFDFKKLHSADQGNEDDEEDDTPKSFNINLDFDLNDQSPNGHRNTGVDIDLMITSESKEETTESYEEDEETFKKSVDQLQRPGSLRRSSDKMSAAASPSLHKNNLEDDNARLELVNKIVERASSKQSNQEKNSYYEQQLPKVNKFSLEDCIDKVLNGDNAPAHSAANDLPGLRSFETLDLEALTRGFDQEEIKNGKLVLYITENQLLQLLKQRAIIVPNSKSLSSHDFSKETLSLIDDKVSSRNGSPSVKEVELVVDEERNSVNKSSLSQRAASASLSQRAQSSLDQQQNCYDSSADRALSEQQQQQQSHSSLQKSNKSPADLDKLKLVDSFIERVIQSRKTSSQQSNPAAAAASPSVVAGSVSKSRQSEHSAQNAPTTLSSSQQQILAESRASSEQPTSSTRSRLQSTGSNVIQHHQHEQHQLNQHSSRSHHSISQLSQLAGRPTGHKIIIKTVRNLPQKVSTSSQQKAKSECRASSNSKVVRKTITYSYLDNYKPTTKVYEVIEPSGVDLSSAEHAKDLFASKGHQSYVLKQFDPLVDESLGKPSKEQVNSYLSIHSAGLKSKEPVQVHPLQSANSAASKESKADLKSNLTSASVKAKEPVIIDSENLSQYSEEVAKHFGSLQITDFPMYVQGAENRHSAAASATASAQSAASTRTKSVQSAASKQ